MSEKTENLDRKTNEKEQLYLDALKQRHSEFIDMMYGYFGLKERPEDTTIILLQDYFSKGVFSPHASKKIGIKAELIKEPLEENLGLEIVVPHETAHYLHYLQQPRLHDFYKAPSYEDNKHGRYINLSSFDSVINVIEHIAELATLVFLEEHSGSASKYKSLSIKLEELKEWPEEIKSSEYQLIYGKSNLSKSLKYPSPPEYHAWRFYKIHGLKLTRERLKKLSSIGFSDICICSMSETELFSLCCNYEN